MKKILNLVVALGLTAGITSCAGYESLTTPFDFRGQGINLTGSDANLKEANVFEVVVNAPAGTSEAIAMNLFEQEARRVCGSGNYSKQITSTGTANVREFGVKGVDLRTTQVAPTITGFVKCQ